MKRSHTTSTCIRSTTPEERLTCHVLGENGTPPSLSANLCRLLARKGSFGSVALLKGRPSFHTSPTSLSRSLGGVAATITPPRSPKPLPCCLLRNNRRLINHLPGSPERMVFRPTGVSLLFSPSVTGGRLPFGLQRESGLRIATAAGMPLFQR